MGWQIVVTLVIDDFNEHAMSPAVRGLTVDDEKSEWVINCFIHHYTGLFADWVDCLLFWLQTKDVQKAMDNKNFEEAVRLRGRSLLVCLLMPWHQFLCLFHFIALGFLFSAWNRL